MNIHPYNVQPKPTKKAEQTEHEEKEIQQPRDNAEFKENRSFKNNHQIEYSRQKKVNISNVIDDFHKTLSAIGASEEINEEVKTYLKLVDTQSKKDKPSPRLIKTNLSSAAGILDEYISETLKKPSKVVTEWINALLLQKIDYKNDNSEQIPEPPHPVKETQLPPQGGTEKTDPSLLKKDPDVQKLQNFYKKTEKLADSGDFRQATINYDKILLKAKKLENKEIETKVYLDKAYIYDVSKDFPSALKNYHKAASIAYKTGDNKTIALSHYNMASIYDDFGKIEPALKHYYTALSYDGQAENLTSQSHTLNDIGNIFSAVKKYKTALDHYEVGVSLTKETNDISGRGFLFSNIASVFKNTGKDRNALRFFKKSIKCDIKSGNLEGYSINYEHSADIMIRNKRFEKASDMYKKSLNAAQKLQDDNLTSRILKKLKQSDLSY